MSKEIELTKKSIHIAAKLFETLYNIDIANSTTYLSLGIHRKDNIVKMWRYARQYGK